MSKEAIEALDYLKRVMEFAGLEFFQDAFDVIRKELTKEPEWQPIETAPICEDIIFGHSDFTTYGWLDPLRRACGEQGRFKKQPTHWMKRPQPPKKGE